jgi:hypothetical protein
MQEYKGTVYGANGKPLSEVKVTLTRKPIPSGPNVSTTIGSTLTDKNGFFSILSQIDNKSKDITLIFYKKDYVFYTVNNPQPTGVYPPTGDSNNENVVVVYYEGKVTLNSSNGPQIKLNQILTPLDVLYLETKDSKAELKFSNGTKITLTPGVYYINKIVRPKAKPTNTTVKEDVNRLFRDRIEENIRNEEAGVRR